MKWAKSDSKPLSTEKSMRVFNAAGQEGTVSVRHEGGRPQPYGGVRDEQGKVLDPCPSFVLERELE